MGFPSPYVLAPRVSAASLGASLQAGFVLGGKLLGANFNSTGDQAIPIASPTPFYAIFRHYVVNPSTSLTTAQGSLYLGPGKSVIINTTTLTHATAQVNTVDTLNNCAAFAVSNNVVTDNATIYLSLTTAQGAPATADVYVYIVPFW